ncbi:MAG: FkbM family methyltransferase [Actinobacteria bacterium]|jgi:FkbM family methyltransferase|nr:FkbM family methyltransferase [Actinomycetota bacterium]
MRRFGTDYGGFVYPSELPGLSEKSVIYCVGAGEDISHDIEIAYATGAKVHIFDPTPRAIQHVELVKQVLDSNTLIAPNKRYGGGDIQYWPRILEHRIPSAHIQLHPYGLYTSDSPSMRFYMPTNNEYVSCSFVEGMKGNTYIDVPVKSLHTIMQELGHTSIDLLKIDIEGCECDVLDGMLDTGINPRYLAVDFDLGWTGEARQDRKRCYAVIERLMRVGYKLLHHRGADMSFQLTSQT